MAGNPFKVNWENKEAVIQYCKKLGPLCCVIKDKRRTNYNIGFYCNFIKEKNPNETLIFYGGPKI